MEARARRKHEHGDKTDLFKIMEKHGRDRLTSGIWARALEAKDPLATELIDRAIEALGTGIASVLLGQATPKAALDQAAQKADVILNVPG